MEQREHPALLALLVLSFTAVLFVISWVSRSSGPPSLADPITFVFSNDKFMKRAMNKARNKNANIVQFHLGPKRTYLISGPQNIQAILSRSSMTYDRVMLEMTFPRLYGFTADELSRFANDKSGRKTKPLPGTENTPPEQRLWHAFEHVHYDFMSRSHHFKPAVEAFAQELHNVLEAKYPLAGIGGWSKVSVIELCRKEVTTCAITALFGPNLLALNPGFVDTFWTFDSYAVSLVLGFPAWINPRPYKAHDQYVNMIQRYLDSGLRDSDWDRANVDADWEPLFGARVCRELVKWLLDAGFERRSAAGALGALLFAQNSNSIPTAMWMLMEILVTAYSIPDDPRTLDIQKVATLPLLQSMFVETLRLHTDFNIMRNVEKPMTVDGVQMAAGTLLLLPLRTAHYEDEAWAAPPDHPADKFWAQRHIKYVPEENEGEALPDDVPRGKKRVFSMAARPSSFSPFGGGTPICPKRHFAKREILTMVAILVRRFEIEFDGWTKLDESPSERRAADDKRYSGGGATPPDRDMVLRFRRIW
ncbi:Cytochrome P450 [Rhypophila sp. PSN 637]